MATTYNPKIITDGLVLNLDAADNNSYPGSGTNWGDLSGNGNDFTLEASGITHNSNGYFDLSNGGAIGNFNIIENIISGGGLKKIYEIFSNQEKSPEEIVSSFNNDESSQKAINFFLNSFSQILSELALAYMPGNGVFIAGGLMRSIHQFIDNEIFMKNFLMNRKSMHANILSQMPIAIINQEMTCLHGSLNFINKISKT